MGVVRDELDRVLCPHGRPMICMECGDEYARELDGPASGAPAAVDERSTERATAESTGALIRYGVLHRTKGSGSNSFHAKLGGRSSQKCQSALASGKITGCAGVNYGRNERCLDGSLYRFGYSSKRWIGSTEASQFWTRSELWRR